MTETPSSPAEIVKAFTSAIAVKDYDTAARYLAPEAEYHNMPEGMPNVTGPEGMRAVLEPFFAPTLENEFVVLREVANGPLVFQERLGRTASHWCLGGSQRSDHGVA